MSRSPSSGNIAGVPGDLPPDQVMLRYAAARYQFRHDNTIEPAAPTATDEVTITAYCGPAAAITAADVIYTTDGTDPDRPQPANGGGASVVPMVSTGVAWMPFADCVAVWQATIPRQPSGTTVRYRIEGAGHDHTIRAIDGHGFWFRYPEESGITRFAYRVGSRTAPPEWFRNAIVYQIFVDRFRRGSGAPPLSTDLQQKHGGDLQGVREALPYLQELGITCVWLTPIGPAPSYHRYDSTDPNGIDPVVGTVEEFVELSRDAAARGIRIILDFVPSHLSKEHPAFIDATRNRDSLFADWFVFYRWPDRYRSFLESVATLPSIDTNSRGARAYLVDCAWTWLDRGAAGFRIDHAIGHGSDFWAEFASALHDTRPDAVTLAEATDTGDAVNTYRGRLDSVLDFPLAAAIRRTFGTLEWDIATFDAFLRYHDEFAGRGPYRVAFIDNHDMDRFLHISGGDVRRLKLALLFLLSDPRPPVLYYGTEVGMSHAAPLSDRARGGDALARQDMPWDRSQWNEDVRRFVARLVEIRTSTRAFTDGWTTDDLDHRAGIWVRSCSSAIDAPDTDGSSPPRGATEPIGSTALWAAYNVGPSTARVKLGVAHDVAHDLTTLVASEPVAVSSDVAELPPFSAALFGKTP